MIPDVDVEITADVEETDDNDEASSDVVVDAAVGNFVFLAALPLMAIHFFNLQHCLKTPGPPFPLLSLQLIHSLQSSRLLHPSQSSHLFPPRLPLFAFCFGSSTLESVGSVAFSVSSMVCGSASTPLMLSTTFATCSAMYLVNLYGARSGISAALLSL